MHIFSRIQNQDVTPRKFLLIIVVFLRGYLNLQFLDYISYSIDGI